MKKIAFGTLLLALCFMVPYLQDTAIGASTPSAPTEDVKMDYATNPSKVVMFSHEDHKGIACVECHHPVKRDGGAVSYKKCSTSGCHDIKGRSQDPMSFYQVMHNRKPSEGYSTCISCHVEKTKTASPEKKKVMLSCIGSGCHPK